MLSTSSVFNEYQISIRSSRFTLPHRPYPQASTGVDHTCALLASELPGRSSGRGVLAACGLVLPLGGSSASSKGSYVKL